MSTTESAVSMYAELTSRLSHWGCRAVQRQSPGLNSCTSMAAERTRSARERDALGKLQTATVSTAIHDATPLLLGRDDALGQAETIEALYSGRGRRQKPKWTFVKYQSADVAHSPASTDAIVPPSTGSTQRGCRRSCTKNTFTTKTP